MDEPGIKQVYCRFCKQITEHTIGYTDGLHFEVKVYICHNCGHIELFDRYIKEEIEFRENKS